MTLKAIIVDDESQSRDLLEKQIQLFCPEIELVGKAQNGMEAARLINEKKPDVVFLDVEMKGETGFDLLKNLGQFKFDVVFTTAHEKYALEAIRFSALDYLLKPILAEDLRRAVSRLFQKENSKDTTRHLDALIYNINYSNADKKLALPTQNGFEFISINDVIYCVSESNYTVFYLKDKSTLLVSKTIMEYEMLLSNYYFIRIHQSYLINLRHIKTYSKGTGGFLIMANGDELEVSRRKKQKLLDALKEFSLMII